MFNNSNLDSSNSNADLKIPNIKNRQYVLIQTINLLLKYKTNEKETLHEGVNISTELSIFDTEVLAEILNPIYYSTGITPLPNQILTIIKEFYKEHKKRNYNEEDFRKLDLNIKTLDEKQIQLALNKIYANSLSKSDEEQKFLDRYSSN